ncbi:MAG: hypothetical protein WCD79_17710 [Chthoniobacteraceae bacterium]
MVAFIIGILLSIWVWRTVKEYDENPLWWTIGTIIVWPVFTTIVGIKYKSRGLAVVGILGLLICVGSVFFFITSLRSLERDLQKEKLKTPGITTQHQ